MRTTRTMSRSKRRKLNLCITEQFENRRYFQATSFTLLPASSKLTVGVTVSGATATSQGASSLNSSESSLTTHFSGNIQTDLTGQNLTFTGGSAVTAENNGTWLPNSSLGSPGQPANFAGVINLGFLFGNVYAAARGWVFDMTSPQYTVPANGSFSTVDSLTMVTNSSNSGTVYFSNFSSLETSTSLGGSLINGEYDNASSGTDVYTPISVGNSSLVVSGNTRTLTVPIATKYSQTSQGLLTTFSYAGVLVATAPAAAAAVTLTGSNYLELDPTTAGQLDVWSGTANAGTPTSTYQLNQVGTLLDAGTSASDTLTVDFTNGDPLAALAPGIGFNTTGASGGSDALLIVGDSDGDTYASSSGQLLVTGGTGASAFTAIPIDFANIANESIHAGTGTDALSVTGGNAIIYTAPGVSAAHPLATLSSLSISSGQKIVFNSPNANRALLELSSAGSWAGQLDLQSNDLLVHGGSSAFSIVNTLVTSGYNQGAWTGQGIASSSAAGNSKHLIALAAMLNNQSGTALFTSSNLFDGIIPAASDVLVKTTYYGDANLSGNVDGSDYTRIDNGYLNHLTSWFNGDFNYDNAVNGSDYTLIDNAFNSQGASLAAQLGPAAKATAMVQAAAPRVTPFADVQIGNLQDGADIRRRSIAGYIFAMAADGSYGAEKA